MRIDPIEIVHVPGHTPGQVMMLVDDVLLSADHILERISPHLAPEQLTLNTGLAHYLESLDKSRPLVNRTELVLGGHERPFRDLLARIERTHTLYEDRLAQVLEAAREPITIVKLADELFGETAGYHRLLALEETGAYVEYLSMRGYLRVEDHERLERGEVAPLRYQSTDDGSFSLQRDQSTAVRGDKVGEPDVRI
jgi:glyoxylase-like metal-dependent hydrolase (beta-lactamase superfamily II)